MAKVTIGATPFWRAALVAVAVFPIPAVLAQDGGTASAATAAAEEPASAADGGVPADWLATVGEEIRRSEYRFSNHGGRGFGAPNRAHGLRSRFEASGLILSSRERGGDQAAGGFTLELTLTGFGRAGSLEPVTTGEPQLDGERAVLGRGPIEEWYVNDERGLEQAFTIERAPVTAGAAETPGRKAVLEMAIGGDLAAFPADDGQAVLFRNGSGQAVVRYGELVVEDARGHRLPARLEIGPGVLRIVFEDAGAAYPVIVDPLMTSPSWTRDGEQSGESFGESVATAGDVNGDGYGDVIVGAPFFESSGAENLEGKSYVYLGSASGLATTADWTFQNNNDFSTLGISASTAGDVNGDGYDDVIVGADGYGNVQANEGVAYLFLGSASGLVLSPAWTVESNVADTRYGYSVSAAGDVNGDGYGDVIVGAYQSGGYRGRAWVYHGSPSGLSLTFAWTADPGGLPPGSYRYGWSVSEAGDVNGDGYDDVVVGGYAGSNGQSSEGLAWVYHGGPSGLSPTHNWLGEGNQESAYFGWSVGGSGDVNGDGYADVIVGAPRFDNVEVDEGRVFVFLGSPSGLATSAVWTAESDETGGLMGESVGTAGDVDGDGYADVIVGATQKDLGEFNEGAAYVYRGGASGPSTTPMWTGQSNASNAQYGESAAAAGDVNGDGYADVIVGARSYDSPGLLNNGRAYAYHGLAGGLSASPAWSGGSDQGNARLGTSVASARDVNGDGFSDLVVGVPYYDGGGADQGRILVYPGSAPGPASPWILEGSTAGEEFGRSVASAGDVNRDGYDDLVVGAPGYGNGETREGRALVFLGSSTGPATTPAWSFESDDPGAELGRSVASAGDLNRDGCADIIVGAPLFTDDQSEEGRAWVFRSEPSTPPNPCFLPVSACLIKDGDQVGANLGWSVASAGDVDRDGRSDVVIGVPGRSNGESAEGAALVYRAAHPPGPCVEPLWVLEGDQAGAALGRVVAAAGDVNRDGYGDVIVGAPAWDNGQTDEGRAFLYPGSAMALPPNPCWTGEANLANAEFGAAAGPAGDVNGDGYDDVAVGAPGYSNGESAEGRVYLYLGSASCPAATAARTIESDSADARLGTSVAMAGDVNGDGFSDLAIGCPACDDGETDEGRAFVHLGNEGGGQAFAVRQVQADLSAPIALLGLSEEADRFVVRVTARSPAGRDEVRLEVEAKPQSVPFDGTGIQSTPPTDTGDPALGGSVELEREVTIPTDHTAYRWRCRVVPSSARSTPTRWLSLPGNGREEVDFQTACTSIAAPASLVPSLLLTRDAGGTLLSWAVTSGAAAYDVVRGDLGTLRSLGGDFSAATQACETDNVADTHLVVVANPAAGEGLWFVVRGANCFGGGSYESGAPSQVGSRDAEIALATGTCP